MIVGHALRLNAGWCVWVLPRTAAPSAPLGDADGLPREVFEPLPRCFLLDGFTTSPCSPSQRMRCSDKCTYSRTSSSY